MVRLRRVGGRRVKRKIGPKHTPSLADGLTRTQAEAELRRLMATTTVIAGAARRTVGEAGTAYIDHLEHVMERKRTTIADCRGYLRRHLARSSVAARSTTWHGRSSESDQVAP